MQGVCTAICLQFLNHIAICICQSEGSHAIGILYKQFGIYILIILVLGRVQLYLHLYQTSCTLIVQSELDSSVRGEYGGSSGFLIQHVTNRFAFQLQHIRHTGRLNSYIVQLVDGTGSHTSQIAHFNIDIDDLSVTAVCVATDQQVERIGEDLAVSSCDNCVVPLTDFAVGRRYHIKVLVINNGRQRCMFSVFNACKQHRNVSEVLCILCQILCYIEFKLEPHFICITGSMDHSAAFPSGVFVLRPTGVGNIAILPLVFGILVQAATSNIAEGDLHGNITELYIVGFQILKRNLTGQGIIYLTYGINIEVCAPLSRNIQGIPLAHFRGLHGGTRFCVNHCILRTIYKVLTEIHIMDKHGRLQFLAGSILGSFQELKVNRNNFFRLLGIHLQCATDSGAGHMLLGNRVKHYLFVVYGCTCEIGLTAIALNSGGLFGIGEYILRTGTFVCPEVHISYVQAGLPLVGYAKVPAQRSIFCTGMLNFRYIQLNGVPCIHHQVILVHQLAVLVMEHHSDIFTRHSAEQEGNVQLGILANKLHGTVFLCGNAQRSNLKVKCNGLESSLCYLIPEQTAIPRIGAGCRILPGITVIALLGQVYLCKLRTVCIVSKLPTVNFRLICVNTEIALDSSLLAGVGLIGSRYSNIVNAGRQILAVRSGDHKIVALLLCLISYTVLGNLEGVAVLMTGDLGLGHLVHSRAAGDNIRLINAFECEQRLAGIHNGKGKFRGTVHRAKFQFVFSGRQRTEVIRLQFNAFLCNGIVCNADQPAICHQPNVGFTVKIHLKGHRILLVLQGNTFLHSHIDAGSNRIGNSLLCCLPGFVGSSVLNSILTCSIVKLVTFYHSQVKCITKTVCSRQYGGKVHGFNGSREVDLHLITIELLVFYHKGDVAVKIDKFLLNSISSLILHNIAAGFAQICSIQIYCNILVFAIIAGCFHTG